MAIRMKEWGMQQAPASTVRIPVENLHGWVDATQRLGSGLASAVLGTQKLLQDEDKVTAEGELAAFSEQLHRIGTETAAELAARSPQDWDYAWQELSAPRLAEAVAALPPAAREAGQELAEAYSAQASLRARRDHKIRTIEQARQNWQQRIDHAVKTGDAERAEQWLQSGEGIFVPAAEIEQRRETTRSQACVARWREAMQAAPLQALAAYHSATAEQLPAAEQDRRSLDAEVHQHMANTRRKLAQEMLTTPHRQDLQPAVAAGVLTQQEYEQACAEPRALNTAEQIDWMRRIDECADDDTARTNILMAIATAPIEPATRNRLQARAEQATRVAPADRRTLSRHLLHLFSQGGFGCPRDLEAQQRLCTLQQTGFTLLAEQGPDAVAEWLRGVSAPGNAWVCFSDLT